MFDENALEEQVREAMLDVMAVLWTHGVKHIHLGALMRLLGVSESTASQHDHETIELDEKFGDMLAELNTAKSIKVPAGTTFH